MSAGQSLITGLVMSAEVRLWYDMQGWAQDACQLLVPSSRTDYFVNMSGQISSRRRQLSTKQWSGNKTKIQTSSYAMNHRDWPGKQWRAERQVMPLHSLDSVLFTNSQAFLKAYFIYILLYKCILSFSK